MAGQVVFLWCVDECPRALTFRFRWLLVAMVSAQYLVRFFVETVVQ